MNKEKIKNRITEELEAKRQSPIFKRFEFTTEELQDYPNLVGNSILKYFEELEDKTGHIKNFIIEETIDPETFNHIYDVRMETDLRENSKTFKQELIESINRYSVENDSDTPDFVLAEYIQSCLDAYTKTVGKRDNFFGFNPWESEGGRKI